MEEKIRSFTNTNIRIGSKGRTQEKITTVFAKKGRMNAV